MATYDRAFYTLRFTGDYKEIEVLDNTPSVVATYDLQASNQSVSVAIEDDDFVIGYTTSFSTATNKIDVGAGSELEFVDGRIGGISVVDFRDMREGVPSPGTFDVQYDLECTTFRLKYVSGSWALWFYFTNTNCITWEPVG
jgi:hypothetical protein